jgi:hypothetical protein
MSAGTHLMPVAPVFDSVCLGVFVLLAPRVMVSTVAPVGSSSLSGPSPSGGSLLRLYASRSQASLWLGATAVIGVAIGMLLRVAGTHRDTPIAFILVAYGFIVLTTFGWRIGPSALSRMARRA